MKEKTLLFSFTFVFFTCGRVDDPIRNKIAFTNSIEQVSDSIAYLEGTLHKLLPDTVPGVYLDRKGYLYANTMKIGLLKNALHDSDIRNNSLFKNFDDSQYDRFISTMKFLLKNHIEASGRDNLSGFYTHEYRRTKEYNYEDLRYVLVNVDTTSEMFVSNYKILDRRNNLVLVSVIDKTR